MSTLDQLAADGTIDASWAHALAPVAADVERVTARVQAERDAGVTVLPAEDNVFRAFHRPLGDVRVLIVGQDPYPTPGHAIGLSFAVDRDVRPLPRSLSNIYKELQADLDITPAVHGDLTAWADQGVMLMNRVLTVTAGEAGSHRRWGWERITEHAIRVLAARDAPLVAVLWGKDAESLRGCLGQTATVTSAHPSPLSASRGFFGSRPFSAVNALLREQNSDPIDWRV